MLRSISNLVITRARSARGAALEERKRRGGICFSLAGRKGRSLAEPALRSVSDVGLGMTALGTLVMTALGTTAVDQQPVSTNLKDAFAGSFRIGAALNANQFSETDTKGAALVRAQFNSITPENVLKWESVH